MAFYREIESLQVQKLEIVIVSDCFGDRRIVEVFLPENITGINLDRLSGVQQKTILHDLPRPFFRIDCPGKFLLTGIIGDRKLRFTLRQNVVKQSREIVIQALSELAIGQLQEVKG